jgi:hypothetical protein
MQNRAGFAIACLALAAIGARTPLADGPEKAPKAVLGKADRAALASRFETEVWPMMAHPDAPEKACLGCHGDDDANTSSLVFSGDPAADFNTLLSEGYFDLKNPSSILAKVAHEKARLRMPPEPLEPWSKTEVERLRRFVEAVDAARTR